MNCKIALVFLFLFLSISIVYTGISIVPLKEESFIKTVQTDETGYEAGISVNIYGIYDTSGQFGHIQSSFLKDDKLHITKFFLKSEFEGGNPDTFLPTIIARVKIASDDLYGYAFSVEPVELFRASFHPDELGDYQPGDKTSPVTGSQVPTPSKEIEALINAIDGSLDDILALDMDEIADAKTVKLMDNFSITGEYLDNISTSIIGWDRERDKIVMESRGGQIPLTQMNYQSHLILYSIYDCVTGEVDTIYITIQTRFLE